ncbi:hypothetical protein [Acinetobacter vivianii]|uniref:hypothetical protein n=1 Tax=Acinetobacter vivianii TaxID=1776742 RepID=UPI003D07895C
MAFNVETADIIAGMALMLSGYATWITLKFNKRQQSLIESQEKLNNLLLEKESNEVKNSKKADLGASFIKLGSNKYRLKIWNKGTACATHVRIEFPEENNVLMQSEIDEKFPLETLETYQSVELIADVHMGTKRKHAIRLIWSDASGENHKKVVYPTL